MLRLTRYLKPYLGMLFLAIVLLFAQANFDLALPDYLSRIVNTGIQQGGVENAAPVAIRQSEMNRVVIFLSADDKSAVLENYTLVDKYSADYDQYVQSYPALEEEPIYVLNSIEQSTMDKLNPMLAKAILAVSTIEQVLADPAHASAMGKQFGFDTSRLPPGLDLFAILGDLPPEQRA